MCWNLPLREIALGRVVLQAQYLAECENLCEDLAFKALSGSHNGCRAQRGVQEDARHLHLWYCSDEDLDLALVAIIVSYKYSSFAYNIYPHRTIVINEATAYQSSTASVILFSALPSAYGSRRFTTCTRDFSDK